MREVPPKHDMAKFRLLADDIARKSFADKLDKAGKPYYNHLKHVAETAAERFGNSPEEKDFYYVLGILHDLLEDCPEWNEKSLSIVFHKSIVDLLLIITKQKDEAYPNYISRIIDSEELYILKIKLVDLEHNMDIKRFKYIYDQNLSMLKRYHNAWIRIQDALH